MRIRTVFRVGTTLSTVVALVGCASYVPPKPHQFESTRAYPDVSFDQGWENVVGFFASHNIPIKNIAKDSGVIYAEAAIFPMGMADCGSYFSDWDEWDQEDKALVVSHGKFNVFFRRGDPITVAVNAEFARKFENSNFPCESTGELEGMVLDAVGGAGRTQVNKHDPEQH